MTLTYRDKGTSGTQLEIISGALVIGHIRQAVLSVVANRASVLRNTESEDQANDSRGARFSTSEEVRGRESRG